MLVSTLPIAHRSRGSEVVEEEAEPDLTECTGLVQVEEGEGGVLVTRPNQVPIQPKLDKHPARKKIFLLHDVESGWLYSRAPQVEMLWHLRI